MTEHLITTVDLLRHGEPEGGPKYRGSLDDPLSEQGWAQLHAAVGMHPPWQALVSSPLRRCAEFAQVLAQQHSLSLRLEDGLREMSFGHWEGRTAAEVMATDSQALARFWQDPVGHSPPGGEPLLAWAQRVTIAWQALVADYVGQHILVLGHGGMMRVVLCHLLAVPLQHIWRFEIPYATFSRIRLYGAGEDAKPALVFHGKDAL
jgi:alpha-ribazole phosphatase/probable phosphoglycerate mutase